MEPIKPMAPYQPPPWNPVPGQPPDPVPASVTPEPQEVTVADLQAEVQSLENTVANLQKDDKRIANENASDEERLEALDGIHNPIQAPAQDEPDPGA